MKNNIAFYVRTGQKNIDEVNAQLSALTQQALEDFGGEFYKIHLYIDNGYSGLSREREGYKALMNDIYKAAFDSIYVTDISRLARNLDILSDVMHVTGTLNVPVIQLIDQVYDDSRTA